MATHSVLTLMTLLVLLFLALLSSATSQPSGLDMVRLLLQHQATSDSPQSLDRPWEKDPGAADADAVFPPMWKRLLGQDSSVQPEKRTEYWTEPLQASARSYKQLVPHHKKTFQLGPEPSHSLLGSYQFVHQPLQLYQEDENSMRPLEKDEERVDFWARLLEGDDGLQVGSEPLQQEETSPRYWSESITTRNEKRSDKSPPSLISKRLNRKTHHEGRKNTHRNRNRKMNREEGRGKYLDKSRREDERDFYVPQIECTEDAEGMERFACPSPNSHGRYICIDDHMLCDGYRTCPGGEDEDRRNCMFYKTTKIHLNVLADYLLRSIRGR